MLQEKVSSLLDIIYQGEKERKRIEDLYLGSQLELHTMNNMMEETKVHTNNKISTLESTIQQYQLETQKHVSLLHTKLDNRKDALIELKTLNESLFEQLQGMEMEKNMVIEENKKLLEEKQELSNSLVEAKNLLLVSSSLQQELVSMLQLYKENT